MKAVQLSHFGGPEVLQVVERPTPAPGPGQVLIRVRAAGLNFAETLMRQNRYAVTPELPAILGTEAAGTVVAVGEGVGGVAAGARVAAPLFAAGALFGGYVDHLVLDADLTVPIPDAVSFEAATALMIQGLTALYLTRLAPPAGKKVLVSAAAGGVGSLLVQLARRAGASVVVAAASTEAKLEFARSLGADAGVDYTAPRWTDRLRAAFGGAGPDLVYESVGGAVTRASLEALAAKGELVVYGALNAQEFQLGVPELLRMIFENQSVRGFAVVPLLTRERLRAGLAELFDLAVRKELRVAIGGAYPLERAADAHRALEGRLTTGKVVLVP